MKRTTQKPATPGKPAAAKPAAARRPASPAKPGTTSKPAAAARSAAAGTAPTTPDAVAERVEVVEVVEVVETADGLDIFEIDDADDEVLESAQDVDEVRVVDEELESAASAPVQPVTPRKPAPKKPAAPRKPVQRKPVQRTPVEQAPAPSAPRTPRTPARPRTRTSAPPLVVRDLDPNNIVLSISGLTKKFGSKTAVAGVDIDVPLGSFYGIVGPNGAGKTTTLSMVTGLLRPDGGSITVLDQDVWRDPAAAKRLIGVLPDRLRLFDRLTGRQLLYYSGTLRGLDAQTVSRRSDDLAVAFGLEDALGRLVADYSAGMTKKIALACAMIHSPRILVLDEPFESVDPVSAANVVEILQKYVAGGGTVVLSSHSMDMIQRVCDRVAIIVEGRVLSKGTVDQVREGGTLEQRFVELAGGRKSAEGMEWLLSSSD